MPSPFPGMDPYLEEYWADVHSRLTLYCCDAINARLPESLVARVEEYLAVEDESDDNEVTGYFPDMTVLERSRRKAPTDPPGGAVIASQPMILPVRIAPRKLRAVHVLDTARGGKLVTAIEFFSLANKVGRRGRQAYARKRRDVLAARASLVEIDLLRAGRPLLALPAKVIPVPARSGYKVVVVRGWRQTQAEVYPLALRSRLSVFKLPLRKKDADLDLDLQPLIDQAYRNGRYDGTIDYRKEPVPPLTDEDATWADALLRAAGKR